MPDVRRLCTLARSLAASGTATVTDLGTLALLVSVAHVPARVASVPALVLAGVVNFVANRRFAFGVRGGRVRRDALAFAAVQAVTIALNAACFEVAMRLLGETSFYWLVRLAIGNAVYLAWSFPMFERIFRPAPELASSSPAGARLRERRDALHRPVDAAMRGGGL